MKKTLKTIDTNKKTILAVDDDPAIIEIFRIILENHGYRFLSAPNGHVAYTMIKANEIDIIFLDIGMPVMDGFELLHLIREQHIHLPVIIMSGIKDKTLTERSKDLGASAYMAKPFTGKRILDVLSEYKV